MKISLFADKENVKNKGDFLFSIKIGLLTVPIIFFYIDNSEIVNFHFQNEYFRDKNNTFQKFFKKLPA